MEIFMHNIPLGYGEYEVKIALAGHLHSPLFPNVKANFQVNIHWPKRGARTVTGTFTMADRFVAHRFLDFYGSQRPRSVMWLGENQIYFQRSNSEPQPEVVELLSRSPWIDPVEERKQKEINRRLSSTLLPLNFIQFGWICRDSVFSIESEVRQKPCHLAFEPERREIQITILPMGKRTSTYVMAVRQSSILTISAYKSPNEGAIIFLRLDIPPTFLRRKNLKMPFYRSATFPLATNERATPYISLAMRLSLTNPNDLKKFVDLSKLANSRRVQSYSITVERRDLFSKTYLEHLEEKIRAFDWCVAFQLEALFRNMDLDATELLGLFPKVEKLVTSHGSPHAANLLRIFAGPARALACSDRNTVGPIMSCFDSFVQEYAERDNMALPVPTDDNFCGLLHAMITPTTMFLTGPFLEKSNHVIRLYDRVHQENFLRVDFRDEDGLQHHFDREVNGRASIHDRFGPFLKKGLTIAGRKFEFLAYSQSALREHSVWFVKPFTDSKHGRVDAKKIIQSLGSFSNLSYDPTLLYCPARYGARLSQAFTATEASAIKVENIRQAKDIKTEDGKYIFTDGSGGMSEDLAREIWRVIGPEGKDTPDEFPHAYQIRFQGSKGMISIDYRLNGSQTIALRPSMIKFEHPESKEIEIARAINRPTPYHLNRHLITLMEGLGVPYGVFQDFQDKAVEDTQKATRSLVDTAQLLETHGLGSSFRLSSVMSDLAKLGIDTLHGDTFYDRLLGVVVYHVLRDLKNGARIPIPDAWALVGVADAHCFLKPNEIFACIKRPDGELIYLDGLVLVSRSPSIHPGDIQVATAIGKPPKGSCLAREPLFNTVVFSVQGTRPLPSCLGGGDLDGDIYSLLPLSRYPLFTPQRFFGPAEYPPAERRFLDKPSTMDDVAEFVMEYIISDVIGLVATNWLVIADQSRFGIKDRACLKLAKLHSDAVDYQKTGRAVNVADIPKLKYPKPDWSAPETIKPDPVNFYRSQSAIGKLSRAIQLDAYEPPLSVLPEDQSVDNRPPITDDAKASSAIKQHISKYIDTDDPGEQILIDSAADLFAWFSGELMNIASESSLSHRQFKPLSEEELIVGTITQKTPRARLRKDKISKMREWTEGVVRRMRESLENDDAGTRTAEAYLRYAWTAWSLSLVEGRKGSFGAKTFGWVAIGALFDAARLIEEQR